MKSLVLLDVLLEFRTGTLLGCRSWWDRRECRAQNIVDAHSKLRAGLLTDANPGSLERTAVMPRKSLEQLCVVPPRLVEDGHSYKILCVS